MEPRLTFAVSKSLTLGWSFAIELGAPGDQEVPRRSLYQLSYSPAVWTRRDSNPRQMESRSAFAERDELVVERLLLDGSSTEFPCLGRSRLRRGCVTHERRSDTARRGKPPRARIVVRRPVGAEMHSRCSSPLSYPAEAGTGLEPATLATRWNPGRHSPGDEELLSTEGGAPAPSRPGAPPDGADRSPGPGCMTGIRSP